MHKKTEDFVEEEDETSSEDDSEENGRQGTWLRKRRLDGALNRVPKGFYPKVWMILENCRGIQIRGRSLDPFLTQGMTSGEMKFALEVESVLNAVPEPEFRQLLVEALIMLREAIGSKIVPLMDETIQLEEIVYEANRIFLQEQIQYDGDATTCCVSPDKSQSTNCGGAAGICRFFYDSAPSGQFGTFCYVVKGAMALFHNRIPTEKENIECLPM
jgi:phosphorylase kinase alpha/beta subunit